MNHLENFLELFSYQTEQFFIVLQLLSRCSRERFKAHESGKLQFSSTEIYDFTSDDLCDLGEIGRGAFGSVNKMIFKKTDKIMAVKVRDASFACPIKSFLLTIYFREFVVRVLLMRKNKSVLWILTW